MAIIATQINRTMAGINEAGAEQVSRLIKRKPYPEAFTKIVSSIPGYEFSHGDEKGVPALFKIYQKRAYSLVSVVLQHNPELIHHGYAQGLTPLFYEIIYGNYSCTLRVHQLMCWGAKFNLSTLGDYTDSYDQKFPAGATALWVACERSPAIDHLVIFLLKQGAWFNQRQGRISPHLSSHGERSLEIGLKFFRKHAEKCALKTSILNPVVQLPLLRGKYSQTFLSRLPNEVFLIVIKKLIIQYRRENRLKEIARLIQYEELNQEDLNRNDKEMAARPGNGCAIA